MANIINEYKVRQVTSNPKTLEELYGLNYNYKYKVDEPIEPNEILARSLMYEKEYQKIISSDYYAHIRICGRVAQYKSESEGFLLNDAFRLYRFSSSLGCMNTSDRIAIDYNKDAKFWVFYISPKIDGEKVTNIWIQPPNKLGSVKCIVDSLSVNRGLILKPYGRNTTGFANNIKPYLDELHEITSNHYKVFKKAFSDAEEYFDEVAGRDDGRPLKSSYEWNYDLLYRGKP